MQLAALTSVSHVTCTNTAVAEKEVIDQHQQHSLAFIVVASIPAYVRPLSPSESTLPIPDNFSWHFKFENPESALSDLLTMDNGYHTYSADEVFHY